MGLHSCNFTSAIVFRHNQSFVLPSAPHFSLLPFLTFSPFQEHLVSFISLQISASPAMALSLSRSLAQQQRFKGVVVEFSV